MNKKNSIIEERKELQCKAECGEISPKEYYDALGETWERMTQQDRQTEGIELRCR